MKVIGVLLVLALGVFFFLLNRVDEKEVSEETMAEVGEQGRPTEPTSPGVRLIQRNPFIRDYGTKDGSVSTDLEALRNVVRDCQLVFKDFDRYHLPGNPEIIRFLQGENPDRLAWIPPGHRFVSEEGELLDRYGTPVFFHRLSGMRFEYRSAGPDRKHWTGDDVVVR